MPIRTFYEILETLTLKTLNSETDSCFVVYAGNNEAMFLKSLHVLKFLP